MKRITLTARIKGLQLRSRWYSLLFTVTRNRRFFDRKIKAGVLMLSLLNLLASCGSTKEIKATAVLEVQQPTGGNTTQHADTVITLCYEVAVINKSKYYNHMVFELTEVDQQPEFPGGEKALYEYIQSHLLWPKEYAEVCIQGNVYVQVEIRRNGAIGKIKLLRGFDDLLDNEAVRVVKTLPRWKPARLNGRKVAVRYPIKVKFALY